MDEHFTHGLSDELEVIERNHFVKNLLVLKPVKVWIDEMPWVFIMAYLALCPKPDSSGNLDLAS